MHKVLLQMLSVSFGNPLRPICLPTSSSPCNRKFKVPTDFCRPMFLNFSSALFVKILSLWSPLVLIASEYHSCPSVPSMWILTLFTSSNQLLIEWQSVSFPSATEEPLYCTISLHDVQEQKKLTEDFKFQLDTPELQSIFHQEVNAMTGATRCSIPLLHTHNRLSTFLIIRVDKHLSSDTDANKSKKVIPPHCLVFFLYSLPAPEKRQLFVRQGKGAGDGISDTTIRLVCVESLQRKVPQWRGFCIGRFPIFSFCGLCTNL